MTWATWQFTAEAAEALPAGVSNVSSFLDLTQASGKERVWMFGVCIYVCVCVF